MLFLDLEEIMPVLCEIQTVLVGNEISGDVYIALKLQE
jgi:hypothetical protein